MCCAALLPMQFLCFQYLPMCPQWRASFFFFFQAEDGIRDRRWRGFRIVEGGDFHCFLRNAVLRAVFAALEVPGLLEYLFEGFLTIQKGDPGIAVPLRAPEPDSEVPRHEISLHKFMIPARPAPGGGPLRLCSSKSKR